ncbi:MAG: ABC transporter ATP-binding protein [Spirochaetaceae bacterium]|nr:ABC transporter ATP-binding protein [Spirochaetaceae bacterium]
MIKVKGLKKRFNLEAGFFAQYGKFVYAVNDVSFTVNDGETYGLVGESGCGKSTTARLLVKMYKADDGEIFFTDNSTNETTDVISLKGSDLKKYREKVKYIFQDPVRSLNPRMTIYDILTSGYKYSARWPGKKIARQEAEKILEEVGLSAADLERRPADFSGGQRQRISIARSLLMQPEVLICDEVVSALDVSIQGQILNLLQEIRQKRNLSMIFIAHDLKVSCYFCDRIGVMYKGFLMEEAEAKDLYKTALHPYTKLLFKSVAGENSDTAEQQTIKGEVKTQTNETQSCPFAERCPHCMQKCKEELPPMKQISDKHKVRCWIV